MLAYEAVTCINEDGDTILEKSDTIIGGSNTNNIPFTLTVKEANILTHDSTDYLNDVIVNGMASVLGDNHMVNYEIISSWKFTAAINRIHNGTEAPPIEITEKFIVYPSVTR